MKEELKNNPEFVPDQAEQCIAMSSENNDNSFRTEVEIGRRMKEFMDSFPLEDDVTEFVIPGGKYQCQRI